VEEADREDDKIRRADTRAVEEEEDRSMVMVFVESINQMQSFLAE